MTKPVGGGPRLGHQPRLQAEPGCLPQTRRLLGLHPGEVMLVAAHNSDLEGARTAGLATAFIARPAEYGPHQARDLTASDDWDLTATSITDLARQLLDDPLRVERRDH
jgi:2-haloacid dehalogenase